MNSFLDVSRREIMVNCTGNENNSKHTIEKLNLFLYAYNLDIQFKKKKKQMKIYIKRRNHRIGCYKSLFSLYCSKMFALKEILLISFFDINK